MRSITPVLWMSVNGEEAVDFWVATFPDSRVIATSRFPEGGPAPAGTWLTIDFEVSGLTLQALNGGDWHPFTDAISLAVTVADQAEVDRVWAALTSDGGEEGPCGWAKDRFGLSWQVIPEGMGALLSDPDPDPARAQRAMAAMMTMKKIDLAAIEAAAAG